MESGPGGASGEVSSPVARTGSLFPIRILPHLYPQAIGKGGKARLAPLKYLRTLTTGFLDRCFLIAVSQIA